MARTDRTFTAADVVRFWANNLDPTEQSEVLNLFQLLSILERLKRDTIINLIGSLFGLIPGTGDAIEVGLELLDLVRQLDEVADRTVEVRELLRDAGLSIQDVRQLFLERR